MVRWAGCVQGIVHAGVRRHRNATGIVPTSQTASRKRGRRTRKIARRNAAHSTARPAAAGGGQKGWVGQRVAGCTGGISAVLLLCCKQQQHMQRWPCVHCLCAGRLAAHPGGEKEEGDWRQDEGRNDGKPEAHYLHTIAGGWGWGAGSMGFPPTAAPHPTGCSIPGRPAASRSCCMRACNLPFPAPICFCASPGCARLHQQERSKVPASAVGGGAADHAMVPLAFRACMK